MPIKSTYLTSSGYVTGAAATPKKTGVYGIVISANQAAPATPAAGYVALKDGSNSAATAFRVDVPATGIWDLSVMFANRMTFHTSCYATLSNAKITALWD